MTLWSKLAVLAVLACFTTAYAQDAVCADLVQQALKTVDSACAPTGRNQACYGNVDLLAMPRDATQGFTFDQQGDLADIADIASLQLHQLDLTSKVWGIALMKVQANLPDTLPGQNVTFVMFGDVNIDNAATDSNVLTVDVTASEISRVRTGPGSQYRIAGAVQKGETASATGRTADSSWLLIQIPGSSSVGWVYTGYLQASGDLATLPVVDKSHQEVTFKPMQAFYFSTGIGQSSCAQAPDGVLIQTPKGQGKINLRANDVDVELGSTAYLQAQIGGVMTVSVVEGQGKLTAQGRTVTVPAGMQAQVPLDMSGHAAGVPGTPQPYDAAALANLPISLLPLQITIAAPRSAPVYPTWTRAPLLPTATVTGPAAVVVTDIPTATYDAPTATYEPPTEPSPADEPTVELPADAPTMEAPTDVSPPLDGGNDIIPTEPVSY